MLNIVNLEYKDLVCDEIADPVDSYVRIAKVLEVRLFSREMLIQCIDGDRDVDTDAFLEEPVTATCVVGSDEPGTTMAPSCTVYGRGDLCAAIHFRNGDIWCASLMDLYEDVNRKNFALIKGWALYQVLGGLLIDFLDDGENSYLTFWNVKTELVLTQTQVTKITGDPSKRHVMRRMLDYFGSEMTHNMSVTTTDWGGWGWDTSRSGPDNNPQRQYHGRKHKGKRVNGFPYVEDVDFTNDGATLLNDIVAYNAVLTGLKTATFHPLFDDVTYNVVRRYFEHATVVWWDDEEPTHVLLVASYPAWSTVQNIYFIEVPVYSMCGRKMLEKEIIDEGLPTEERNIVQSWQMYNDQIRVVHTIDRSTYIDFLVVDDDLTYSERLSKAAVAYLPYQPDSETKDFGILDGHCWTQGGSMFEVNRVKKIQGTIERELKDLELEDPEANGSIYNYTIVHNDPATTGNLDLGYSINFIYEYDGGSPYETQTHNNPTKGFNCYTDGVNSMEKRLDFDYYCLGGYDKDVDFGRLLWDDSSPGGGAGNAQQIDNYFEHSLHRNGIQVHKDTWDFKKALWGQANEFQVDSTFYILMYADVEYDLFCYIKVVTSIPRHLGIGPGWTFLEAAGTHKQFYYGVVIFQGVEWYLWNYEVWLDQFPSMWNFFPWVNDIGIPYREDYEPGPYSVDTDYTSYYMYAPTLAYTLGTLKTGYSTIGFGSPAPYFGPEGIQTWQVIKTDDYAQPDDLLQVSIDYDYDSFCVLWESPFQTDSGNNKWLTVPNGNALYRFDGGTPHFIDPSIDSIIDLSI